MSSANIAVVLSAASALAELAGLGLVAREIARDQRQAKRLLGRRPRQRPETRTYPGHQSPPSQLARYGPPDARKLTDELAAAVGNALIVQRKEVDAEIDRCVDKVRKEAATAVDLLRDTLVTILAGSFRDRVIGAILIAAGIVLAAAGSVVGTSS